MRTSFLPFSLPDIDDAEINAVRDVLKSGWLTTGEKSRQFETRFAAKVKARYCVAVNSATAALHLALEAIGLGAGDEVITSPYTFAASAEVIRYFGAKPVFVDVCAGCLNIDPRLIECALTERTKAIMPIHVAGLPAELDAIFEIAAQHRLAVVEDAAHAFPVHYKHRWIGQAPVFPDGSQKIRHAVAYSFYATKTITTGEGGMLATDDPEIADRSRIMSLHGISRDAWKRYSEDGSWYYEIIAPGYKYNLTDIASAIGLVQLEKADRMTARRAEIAAAYGAAFCGIPELEIAHTRVDSSHSWHLYVLRLNLKSLKIGRGEFVSELKRRNIGSSVHFIPLHLHPYYRKLYDFQPEDFPIAYREYKRALSLPIYSKMSDEDVADVIAAVREIVEKYRGGNHEERTEPNCGCAGADFASAGAYCHRFDH